jgi:hypothetical protein
MPDRGDPRRYVAADVPVDAEERRDDGGRAAAVRDRLAPAVDGDQCATWADEIRPQN